MRSKPVRILLGLLASCIVLLLAVALAATRYLHQREKDPTPDAQKLARTLEIIRTSTAEHHKVLKVLFYGQSITKSGWESGVLDHWHTTYPNTVFVTQNRALGGFPSTDLLRSTEQDIAAFTPDLIVFQVYGNHRDYEKIIRLFRSRTAADIILQNDHGNTLPDPVCTEGIRRTLHRPAGCTGTFWLHQRVWEDEMSYHHVPSIAKKYGAAMEPQRIWYRNYFLRTHIDPRTLTIDGLHPNEQGKVLLARFFNQYFDSVVASWNGQTSHAIESLPASTAQQSDIAFDGTRLELLTSAPLTTFPAITLDGTPTASTDGCYLNTRASTVSIVPDWPSTRRITLHHDHTVEDWTAVITNISPDQKHFHFTLHGSVTGDDGSGDSTHDFTSNSGKLELDAQDWMPARAFNLKHTTLPTPFTVTWSVINQCAGTPEVNDHGNGQTQYRYTLVTGAPNTRHTLHWQTTPELLQATTELRAYKPPLN